MKIDNSITSALILKVAFIVAYLSSSIKAADISLVEFQGILFSEINSEINEVLLQTKQNHHDGTGTHDSRTFLGRFLKEQDVSPKAQDVWNKTMQHGWDRSLRSNNPPTTTTTQRNSVTDEASNQQQKPVRKTSFLPYIVCSHNSNNNKSGFQRLELLLKNIGAYLDDAIMLLNKSQKTCYHISLDHDTAQSIKEKSFFSLTKNKNNVDNDSYYTIAPLTDLMKIEFGTMDLIYSKSWNVPTTPAPNTRERTIITVGISPGHRINQSKEDAMIRAMSILKDVKSMGESGAKNRQRRSLLQEGKMSSVMDDVSVVTTLSEMFSVTASSGKDKRNKEMGKKKPNKYQRRKNTDVDTTPPYQQQEHSKDSKWHRALELGLEADHACQTMFDAIDISIRYDNQRFDIILNNSDIRNANHSDGIEEKQRDIHDEERKNDIIEELHHNENKRSRKESSASNKHCVASLIMALSTHPLVLSVGIEDDQIKTADYESEWITQSKIPDKRPLRDIMGLNGEGQTISIIDDGLDVEHKYFGPTDAKVFDDWDHSQRKVVRYASHDLADRDDKGGDGHGTKVAGVAAGQLDDGSDDEANGIAPGAKLHIYDIFSTEKNIRRMASAQETFESMHRTGSKPARIANASWIVGVDHETHKPLSSYRPTCIELDRKLYGEFQDDLYVASAGNAGFDEIVKESRQYTTIGFPAACKNSLAVGASYGMDYIAAFSSRGPTIDGRMKPDLVAPGVSVLTPKGYTAGGTARPSGTSFAAPVVSGNAALVRQYFEEGKAGDRCGLKVCKFDPSGTLVKAVLLNSARPLKQVKSNEKLLEQVREYDSNQGMGLIQLDKTLPIPGHNNINAIVRNKKEIKDGQDQYIYIQSTLWECMNEAYMHEFSATLTWYDPQGAMGCVECMLDDLDIAVHRIDESGKVIWNSGVFPNGGTKKDSTNNVERVRFDMNWKARYRIRIRADNLTTATTTYSMVASGCFKQIKKPAVL